MNTEKKDYDGQLEALNSAVKTDVLALVASTPKGEVKWTEKELSEGNSPRITTTRDTGDIKLVYADGSIQFNNFHGQHRATNINYLNTDDLVGLYNKIFDKLNK